MSDWRPIETAPKDGTPILGYDPRLADYASEDSPSDAVAVMAWYQPYGPDEPTEWKSTAYDVVDYKPTHWMPLPEPPPTKP